MNEIINSLFESYDFVETWTEGDVHFYKNTNKHIVSYFLTYFVDCTGGGISEETVGNLLKELEIQYVTNEEYGGLKFTIMDSFQDKKEASQIDKNTSAIYLVKFDDNYEVSAYKNVIYSIEESPSYFKRYIIPYTEKQINELKKVLCNFENTSIAEVLNDLVNREEDYYKLLEGKRSNSLYEFVIRLFSKIPFLQYRFTADSSDINLEQLIDENISEELKKYDEAIKEGNEDDLNYLLALTEDIFSIEDIEGEVNKLLGEN